MTVSVTPATAAPSPTCNGQTATIVGTDGDDRLVGTPGNDVFSAGSGNDVVIGLAGNDTVCAGTGDDLVYAHAGTDQIHGASGNDGCWGGEIVTTCQYGEPAPAPAPPGVGNVDPGAFPSVSSGFDPAAWLATGERIPASMAWEPSGNFRTFCGFSHLSYDDPIVYPGQPGASHLHMYFGNTGANAHSTYQSLRSSGSSTCQGGPLNRTGYWVPAMHNAAGRVVVPEYFELYYKGNGSQDMIRGIQTYPNGLRHARRVRHGQPGGHPDARPVVVQRRVGIDHAAQLRRRPDLDGRVAVPDVLERPSRRRRRPPQPHGLRHRR